MPSLQTCDAPALAHNANRARVLHTRVKSLPPAVYTDSQNGLDDREPFAAENKGLAASLSNFHPCTTPVRASCRAADTNPRVLPYARQIQHFAGAECTTSVYATVEGRFFNTCRTVSYDTLSTYSSATIRSANKRNVQRA